jgi:hypothetical protein
LLRDKSNYKKVKAFSLADELLEQTKVKICKVNHITDFFEGLKPRISPLSEEAMLAEHNDRYYLPVRL